MKQPSSSARPRTALSAAAGWSPAGIRALGPVTDVPTAAAIFGIGRSTAYVLLKIGEFPIPVIQIGSRYRVPVAAILAALHLPVESDEELPPPPT
ncbi:helix-turn-helix domain-containing protein [Actinoplanes sp. NPDC023801]|uniref:helix-turn-helix domain-containing protein n=1 Tax=Actinoplanes sp. NPDC023801 TaxID=3154595 RepID=UPI0033CA4A15